ncbi:hypothetical protein SAMN05660909_01321 [Chitinophaga terrae (ex Kim and Jung 2007)]|uniref:DUF4292 domain-containing protein n=1 Tax=Chitinophaga terrae (ex Kim and Jung 2007) TaxID=408074 RepID=A0A1H3ZWL2_9BACT|nr:hypothetical protein [Chitinophaga terrae (ex Kim and Jung 2007)]SEA27684.1 hypothetical protein SAMN05660909_01321 [Chitinophaga terrae (ex Kim and Jung 2007)]
MKRIFIISCCILIVCQVSAQNNSSLEKAHEILAESSALFNKEDIAMDIVYTYADEHSPGIITDSLRGYVLISGNNYRGEIGNTLTVKNSRYSIMAFKDDKLLYVAAPTGKNNMPDAAAPLQLITDAIKSAGVNTCAINEVGDVTELRFDFPAGMTYKQMRIIVESRDKRIKEVNYVIRKSLLPEEEKTTKDLYAQVRTLFIYRKTNAVSASEFDERQFFTQKANSLLPTPAYKDYEVFIGSPSN